MAGCGPAVVDPEASDSADGSSGTDPDSTTGTPGTSTTGVPPVTTAATSPVSTVTTITTSLPPPQTSTSSSSHGSSFTGSSTGTDACGPTEDFQALVWVNNGTPPGAQSLDCVITSVDYELVTTEIDLDCGGLELAALPRRRCRAARLLQSLCRHEHGRALRA
jgi:hypothetical protein